MDVLENIKEACRLLKEVEEYNEQLNGEDGLISICDQKIDYWEHYLEFEPLKVTEAYNINKEIKKQRNLRRKYKDDADIIRVFKENAAKLQTDSNRDILLAQVCKTDSKHKNAKYAYSAYTEEERDAILGRKPKPVVTLVCDNDGLGIIKGEDVYKILTADYK